MITAIAGKPRNDGTFVQKGNYVREELVASGHREWGDRPPLPLPPYLLMDRVVEITSKGGDFDKGFIRAEFDVTPDMPCFEHHFKGDPVMPGKEQVDALWQAVGFFVGWSGAYGKGRATGCGEVKLLGEITPTARLLEIRVDISRIMVNRKIQIGFGDGKIFRDGALVCKVSDLNATVIHLT